MKKSIKDYAIYFLTLVLGVAIFYMFNSIDSQQAMLQVSLVTIRTSRELKEDFYIKLEVMVTRGVKTWKEVQANELPEKVKTALNVE